MINVLTNKKINSISKFGLTFTDNPKVWYNLAKGTNSEILQDLKRDMVIDVQINDDGKITDIFDSSEVAKDPKPSEPSIDSRARDILKGQCLNIAFEFVGRTGNLFSPQSRKEAIDLGVVLFAELQNAGYLRW